MFDAVLHNLRRLTVFSGRDSRALFWPYIVALFGVTTIANFAAFIPEFLGTFSRMQRFAVEHPDQATVTSGPGSYSISIQGSHPELMPDVSRLVDTVSLLAVAFVVLAAASVVRRLHDRDRSGMWGILPLPFLTIGLILSRSLFHDLGPAGPDFRLFFGLFFNNLVYLIVLVFLIVLLAGAGTAHGNRFGSAEPHPGKGR